MKWQDEVKQYRVRLAVTQVELARSLGYCLDTVSSWEEGRRTPCAAVRQMVRYMLEMWARRKDK